MYLSSLQVEVDTYKTEYIVTLFFYIYILHKYFTIIIILSSSYQNKFHYTTYLHILNNRY